MVKIAVCVPTYKRPIYLKKCIDSLIAINMIEFDIIVIDNDINKSALKTIDENLNKIIYLVQTKLGIPHVRNKVVDYCKNNNYTHIAFIDDDEQADINWLINLYNSMKKYNADVVHGPSISKFSNKIPFWAHNSHFFIYKPRRMKTGTRLNSCATNNILMNLKIFEKFELPFDKRMVLTGGSDTLFFSLINKQFKMVWCDEALVYENIPKSRQSLRWNLMRTLRNGNATALILRIKREKKLLRKQFFKWVLKLPIKLVILPLYIVISVILFYFIGFKVVVKFLSRIYYGFGFILGAVGYRYAEYSQNTHGE